MLETSYYGSIGLTARMTIRINRLGRGYLALTDFRYKDFILNGLVGDSTLTFHKPSGKIYKCLLSGHLFSRI